MPEGAANTAVAAGRGTVRRSDDCRQCEHRHHTPQSTAYPHCRRTCAQTHTAEREREVAKHKLEQCQSRFGQKVFGPIKHVICQQQVLSCGTSASAARPGHVHNVLLLPVIGGGGLEQGVRRSARYNVRPALGEVPVQQVVRLPRFLPRRRREADVRPPARSGGVQQQREKKKKKKQKQKQKQYVSKHTNTTHTTSTTTHPLSRSSAWSKFSGAVSVGRVSF